RVRRRASYWHDADARVRRPVRRRVPRAAGPLEGPGAGEAGPAEDGRVHQRGDCRRVRLRPAHGGAQAASDPQDLGAGRRTMNTSEANSEDPSVVAERRLGALCDRFEAAWRNVACGGPRPSLAAFVEESGADAELVRELVLLDLHYRRRQGERPLRADYPRWE